MKGYTVEANYIFFFNTQYQHLMSLFHLWFQVDSNTGVEIELCRKSDVHADSCISINVHADSCISIHFCT